MSLIISQDITQPINVSTLERTAASSRDSAVTSAYRNDPWLRGSAAIDQKFCQVDRDLLFQILMIENISKSKLSQIDDIKTRLDPKQQKSDRLSSGREKVVINQVDVENEETNLDQTIQSSKRNVFKLTIQDKTGAIYYAMNSTNLPWLAVCMLGSKLIINRGTNFVRGVFLLNESNCTFLGGVNQLWNENREAKVQEYLEAKLHRENGSPNSGHRKKRSNIMT
ncbi:Rmi1p TDEL_0B01610 [Torulaspora delbrueckii]|uniref:RecQ mediated genome instability protein 1 OB-fold domain-containing protein n=1 Tax=Torulaspora delbrueckii TaxID=4950 RepID=G8ZNU6_TORDE|nr:hypothetical protein TDEL_0B01610 [Torulaspora delbrueckii]CCE90290.1 hypothetical protein TDEL_0B01610 [Torulaspora delbrueckii]